ncbi:MAG TPA: NADH-quinone oxidoreductase subunit C [Gammaproteobacteria bacterium]|nr:NADH-quinone oxidoreductase subunit C [Gammaproteobacteria bacterium]
MNLTELKTALEKVFGATVALTVAYDEITATLNASDLLRCCLQLRDAVDLQFNQLIDLCGVDYLTYGIDDWATNTSTFEGFSRGVMPEATPKNKHEGGRFAVVYHLLSTVMNHRLRVKVFAPGDPPMLPSVINIWQSANWYEREAFDMFGILFDDHPDLRRLLTDYGFVGHPFRKDFPLIGQVEMRYDAAQQRVVYEPVTIAPRTLTPKVIRYIGQEENG